MMSDKDNTPSTEELRGDPLLFMNTFFFESNPMSDDYFHNMFMKGIEKRKGYKYESTTNLPPFSFIGVDWAKDSGMNRGDIMSRNDNVIEVRFKTVTINN